MKSAGDNKENTTNNNSAASIFKTNNNPVASAVVVVMEEPKSPSLLTSNKVVPVYPDEHSAHPNYLAIMAMKVNELRKELKANKLETTGLKKELQKRLLTAIVVTVADVTGNVTGNDDDDDVSKDEDDEEDVFEDAAQDIASVAVDEKPDRMSFVLNDVAAPVVKKETALPVVPAAAAEKKVASSSMSDKKMVSSSMQQLEKKMLPSKQHAEKKMMPPMQHSFVKSTAALFSPTKLTSKFQQPRPHETTTTTMQQKPPNRALSPFASLKKSIVKTASTFMSSKVDNVVLLSSKKKSKNDDFLAKMANAGEEADTVEELPSTTISTINNYTMDVENSMMSSAVKVAHDGTMEASLTSTVSSSVKDKQKQLADARKQRLAEMRGKSKPLTSATSKLLKSTDKIEGSSSLINKSSQKNDNKLTSSSTSKLLKSSHKEDDKRTLMTAKMREKHAALKSSTKQPFKNTAQPKAAIKTALLAPVIKKVAPQQPLLQKAPPQLDPVEVEKKSMSPLDTYQMSDREDSDSYESDDGPKKKKKKKKKFPAWAQKENLIPALKKQYDENGDRLDPDLLFPEVETCDLEAIFDKKESRFNKRNSSGDWTKDQVTAAEILTYKRTMDELRKNKMNGWAVKEQNEMNGALFWFKKKVRKVGPSMTCSF